MDELPPLTPAPEAMSTMTPLPAFSISGTVYFETRKLPFRLMSMTLSQVNSSNSSTGTKAPSRMPAALIKPLMCPKVLPIFSKSART